MKEEQQLRDILPPVLLPEEPNYLLYAAVITAALCLFALAFWFFKTRKKKVVKIAVHETALAELLSLRSMMTPEQAQLYAKKVSDILRFYIEKRFRIPSTIQTTKEFFAALEDNHMQAGGQLEEHGASLKQCLEQCDMAKFARMVPDKQSMEQMEEAVQQLIETTREDREGGK